MFKYGDKFIYIGYEKRFKGRKGTIVDTQTKFTSILLVQYENGELVIHTLWVLKKIEEKQQEFDFNIEAVNEI